MPGSTSAVCRGHGPDARFTGLCPPLGSLLPNEEPAVGLILEMRRVTTCRSRHNTKHLTSFVSGNVEGAKQNQGGGVGGDEGGIGEAREEMEAGTCGKKARSTREGGSLRGSRQLPLHPFSSVTRVGTVPT